MQTDATNRALMEAALADISEAQVRHRFQREMDGYMWTHHPILMRPHGLQRITYISLAGV